MAVLTLDVQTKPTRLLSANPKRVAFMLINDSGVDVYVGFDKNVSTTGKRKGVLLAANGGVWAYEYHKGELWAIAPSQTQITVVESSEGE